MPRSFGPVLFGILAAAALTVGAVAAPVPGGKAWTIMIYMMADNDLEEAAVEDLAEIAAASPGAAIQVVILADRGSLYSGEGAGGLPAWKGAKKLSAQGKRLSVIEDWGVSDLGRPESVARFVSETIASHPAERYALVFWDHGGAWTGFGVDESASSVLDILEIERGLEDGLNKAGLAKLDLLGFDACLMADFDTIARLRSFARFYLASPELEPGHGWDYGALNLLAGKPGAGPAELGTVLAEAFVKQAVAKNESGRAMLSLVDLAKFGALETAVEDFARQAREGIGAFAPGLGRSAGSSPAFGKAGSPDQDANLIDLASFVSAAADECPALAPRRDSVLRSLASAVTTIRKEGSRTGPAGISVYFPNRGKDYDPSYAAEGHPAWIELLSSYYRSGTEKRATAVPLRFDADANRGELDFKDGLLRLSGALNPGAEESVVDSGFRFGIFDGGETVFLGDDEVWSEDGGKVLRGSWDGTVLLLRQGARETWGYLSLSSDEGGGSRYSIPLAYFKDGRIDGDDYDSSYLDLEVDADGGIVSSALYKETVDGMTAELRPAKGSRLVPLVEVVDAGGESAFARTEDWGFDAKSWESIELDFRELGTGTQVYVEIYAADSTGDGDFVFGKTEWP